MKIDAIEVTKVFVNCLYNPEGLKSDSVPTGAVIVDGIMGKYGLNPDRLELHREQVAKWLKALPSQFQASVGGGWSFLNACNDEDGEQWTGLHQNMEELFCLGLGLQLVTLVLPRDLWDALPGGMPYYCVNV